MIFIMLRFRLKTKQKYGHMIILQNMFFIVPIAMISIGIVIFTRASYSDNLPHFNSSIVTC